jgi:glycosyltransferase involved in cell wall biosynthesis
VRDIFIVCNNVEELGGLQRWAHHAGHLFAGRGHRVHLIGITHAAAPHDYGHDVPYDLTVLHESPVPHHRGGPGGIHRRAVQRRGAATLSRLFRAARPGGVIIAAQVWAMEWVALADTAGLPVIGMSHESYEATKGSSRYERVKRYFADVDRFLVLSTEDADAWARDHMSNADFMPNPLHVTPARRPDLSAPVVELLGRLSFEKGQDMMLEAWAEVRDRFPGRFPGWRLRLHGSGPDEEALRLQADELGISGTVEFAGTTADVEGALNEASVFALSSRVEGFPMSVLEAMAYGLPTVAFDCAPGVRELITDESDGLLVQPGNTVEFAEALARLMADEGLRAKLGRQARTSVRRFSADLVMDRWERLFALVGR